MLIHLIIQQIYKYYYFQPGCSLNSWRQLLIGPAPAKPIVYPLARYNRPLNAQLSPQRLRPLDVDLHRVRLLAQIVRSSPIAHLRDCRSLHLNPAIALSTEAAPMTRFRHLAKSASHQSGLWKLESNAGELWPKWVIILGFLPRKTPTCSGLSK